MTQLLIAQSRQTVLGVEYCPVAGERTPEAGKGLRVWRQS